MIHFDLDNRQKEIEQLSKQTEDESFWKDQNNSRKVIAKINQNKKLIESYNSITDKVNKIIEAINTIATIAFIASNLL